MALYAIGDLHLCLGVPKPMDIFGGNWTGYMDKLKEGMSVITDADTTVLLGDLSWALSLEESAADFTWINEIPGRKIILKGNHDYWWSTVAKFNKFCETNSFKNMHLLNNNCFEYEDWAICGTRGWFVEEEQQVTVGTVDYAKIVNREVQRLKISLDAAVRLREGEHQNKEILVFLHFPPVFGGFECREIIDVLHEYGIRRCFYGHIHSSYRIPRSVEYEGVELTLVSSDFLNFVPMLLFPEQEWG